ncbi:hypothetical protein ACFT9M_25770 [Micromonospora purpureochromogenes]
MPAAQTAKNAASTRSTTEVVANDVTATPSSATALATSTTM